MTRHSQADTFDKVKRADLDRAVEALAGLVRWLADRAQSPAPRLTEAETAALIRKIEVGPFLELLNLKPR